MRITPIQANYYNNNQLCSTKANNIKPNIIQTIPNYAKIPITHRYGANISFQSFFDPNRTVPHIDYEEYMAMKEVAKRRFRKKYNNFFQDKTIDTQGEMIDDKFRYMPLRSEALMDEFINTAKIYSKYKEHPIICLGRSPKWFLNASLWMKDGIDDYKFVAFSKNWYKPDNKEGIIRLPDQAPTPKEETAYRKYLKRIKADPQTIVEHMQKTGKKTVITDYIFSGKGVSSFLEIMSNYAKDLGILEEFCKSIHIVGIGSKDYMEEMLKVEYAREPRVVMPELMKPFEKEGLWHYNVTQEFYNIDYLMFREMLINQNTNECRSTYYPHETWTVYQPDRFKTGLIKDIKKVKEMVKTLKGNKSMSSFTPAMYDYRNLLNFRILDGLNTRNLLKAVHKSKI